MEEISMRTLTAEELKIVSGAGGHQEAYKHHDDKDDHKHRHDDDDDKHKMKDDKEKEKDDYY
jgi:hypothetical protein